MFDASGLGLFVLVLRCYFQSLVLLQNLCMSVGPRISFSGR
jgi:hypothetical protein